ncbi:MAG: hypothetical protein K2X74_22775, partial [Acetobacteraceae bacterium]|nr:hypothetical protein [Acetobacteraceae bacterium]
IGPPVGLRLGGMEPRGALLAVVDLGQGPLRVVATHLSLGTPRRRRLQAEAMLAALRDGPEEGVPGLRDGSGQGLPVLCSGPGQGLPVLCNGRGQGLPVLLLGDLNEWRPGAGGALDTLAPEFALPPPVPSFPSFRPVAALDRILARPAGMLRRVAAHDTALARRASDHLPLVGWVEAVTPSAAEIRRPPAG